MVLNVARFGARHVLAAGQSYRLVAASFYTTTMRVRRGSLTLIKDGKSEFDCVAGASFRIFTRGWSSFVLEAAEDNTVVEVAALEYGDQISPKPFPFEVQ
ncbi:hypothetical protein UP09_30665 [Bradyrhizobium sp. LTSP885]|nr:hypothetical protein UP09_30665 [Bradyrhizobium sp. LTSP885]